MLRKSIRSLARELFYIFLNAKLNRHVASEDLQAGMFSLSPGEQLLTHRRGRLGTYRILHEEVSSNPWK